MFMCVQTWAVPFAGELGWNWTLCNHQWTSPLLTLWWKEDYWWSKWVWFSTRHGGVNLQQLYPGIGKMNVCSSQPSSFMQDWTPTTLRTILPGGALYHTRSYATSMSMQSLSSLFQNLTCPCLCQGWNEVWSWDVLQNLSGAWVRRLLVKKCHGDCTVDGEEIPYW